jgi:uncharacterized membrane protein
MQISLLSNPKFLVIVIVFFSFIGFTDATYLTASHFLSQVPPCTIAGCEVVLTSQYAILSGIPLALLGSLFYLFVFVFAIWYLDSRRNHLLFYFPIFGSIGFLASLYFLYLQGFVLRAFCQYCILSAATSTGIFLASLQISRILTALKHDNAKPQPPMRGERQV